MNKKSFGLGILVGFGIMLFLASITPAESAIPPTNAIKTIIVSTASWAGFDTTVDADSYNDEIFLVSDGSITFNVTEAYP